MANFTPLDLTFIILAGIFPALLWVWFWLKEDSASPEPKSILFLSFCAGALAVVFVLPMEEYASGIIASPFLLIVSWSAIEELMKYFAAFVADFNQKAYDEPVDTMIYLVIVALGFAAL